MASWMVGGYAVAGGRYRSSASSTARRRSAMYASRSKLTAPVPRLGRYPSRPGISRLLFFPLEGLGAEAAPFVLGQHLDAPLGLLQPARAEAQERGALLEG